MDVTSNAGTMAVFVGCTDIPLGLLCITSSPPTPLQDCPHHTYHYGSSNDPPEFFLLFIMLQNHRADVNGVI